MELLNNREEYLSRLAEIITPKPVCMEIGVDNGAFSSQIYKALNPKKLVLVDPFDTLTDPISQADYYPTIHHRTVYSNETSYNHVNAIFEKEIADKKVVIDRNLSVNAISNYKDKTFDFIYIDACHIYESVLWDIENYIHKVKKGGFIGGHDYINHPSFGVIKAVDEFCTKHDYEIIMLVQEGMCGDWLLSAKK
jgi:hypothetical protein